MIGQIAESGAIDGVKYVVSSSYDKFSRIFWAFSTLLSICGFFYYIYPAWMKLMFQPETMINTVEKNIQKFPWPAITVCSNVFAIDSIVKFSERNVTISQKKPTEEECKIYYANLMWCSQHQIEDLYGSCKNEVLHSTNVAEKIYESSLTHKELILTPDPNQITPQKTSLTGSGPCYTYNSLSYSSLFKKENIHDDFKQFLKFVNITTKEEDNSTWSPEKGLKMRNGTEIFPRSKRAFRVGLKLSPGNADNVCFEKAVKIFIHKPNEIVNFFHESYELNHNEVSIYFKY
jgi:Amiloride-sensitive sodium channel